MMKIFLLVIISVYIHSIHAQNSTISTITRQINFSNNQTFNRPNFTASIRIYNATTNQLITSIDVSLDTVNATYSNSTLTFNIPAFTTNDQFYVTFDAGVLFSNAAVNSSAQTDPNFLRFKVLDLQTSTSFPATLGSTYIGTTQYINTGMTNTNPSASTGTMMTVTHTTGSQTTSITQAGVVMNTGEPPPTRSAQLGMGLGITFITVLIIIEIIYFKFCYSGNGRGESYYP